MGVYKLEGSGFIKCEMENWHLWGSEKLNNGLHKDYVLVDVISSVTRENSLEGQWQYYLCNLKRELVTEGLRKKSEHSEALLWSSKRIAACVCGPHPPPHLHPQLKVWWFG